VGPLRPPLTGGLPAISITVAAGPVPNWQFCTPGHGEPTSDRQRGICDLAAPVSSGSAAGAAQPRCQIQL